MHYPLVKVPIFVKTSESLQAKFVPETATLASAMKSLSLFIFILFSINALAEKVYIADPEVYAALKANQQIQDAKIQLEPVDAEEAPQALHESGKLTDPIAFTTGNFFVMQQRDLFIGQIRRDETYYVYLNWFVVGASDETTVIALHAPAGFLSYLNHNNGEQTTVYKYDQDQQAITFRNGIGVIATEYGPKCRVIEKGDCEDVRQLTFTSERMLTVLVEKLINWQRAVTKLSSR